MIERGPSRQLVITLPGPLAASSLAQDAREARGTMASLVVVARATVLTTQHRIVAHPSCGDKAKGQGRQEGVINRSLGDRAAENINGQVRGAQAASSCPVRIDLCPKSTADTLGRVKPRTFVEERTEVEETDNQDTYCTNTSVQPTACKDPSHK